MCALLFAVTPLDNNYGPMRALVHKLTARDELRCRKLNLELVGRWLQPAAQCAPDTQP